MKNQTFQISSKCLLTIITSFMGAIPLVDRHGGGWNKGLMSSDDVIISCTRILTGLNQLVLIQDRLGLSLL